MYLRWTADNFGKPRLTEYDGEECHFFRSGDVRLTRQASPFPPQLLWRPCTLERVGYVPY